MRADGTSLATQYTRWLAALFVAIVLVTITSSLIFVLWPLASRAADDFVGVLALSAESWVEMSPAERPIFERELAGKHQILLRPGMQPPPDTALRHGFYVYFVERALERRFGQASYFVDETAADGSRWFWTAVTAPGMPSLGIGFSHERIETNPLVALGVVALVGAVLVSGLAWRLARRVTEPIARLERAAAQLAQGAEPALLPEAGPRELADLARHFNQMSLQLRVLSDARTTLFAGISHDLRTPLARMRLALEMLTLRPDPSLLTRLVGDVELMNRLIGQMLEIARGLSTEPPQELMVCDWLQQRARVHAEVAAAAGARIAVRCDPGLRVRTAVGMLTRVFDNLIGNALTHAPGPVDLVAEIGPGGGATPGALRLGVLDRGPSIPADQLDAVFRPFHRVDSSRSPATGGFGLGLAIVRQLARANGWHVSLSPREGGGLQAWVELEPMR